MSGRKDSGKGFKALPTMFFALVLALFSFDI
jgi:hypothetical protein